MEADLATKKAKLEVASTKEWALADEHKVMTAEARELTSQRNECLLKMR